MWLQRTLDHQHVSRSENIRDNFGALAQRCLFLTAHNRRGGGYLDSSVGSAACPLALCEVGIKAEILMFLALSRVALKGALWHPSAQLFLATLLWIRPNSSLRHANEDKSLAAAFYEKLSLEHIPIPLFNRKSVIARNVATWQSLNCIDYHS